MTVIEAMADDMAAYEREIESLKRQRSGLIASNALLQEQVNEAQLKASHAIALSKFSEAQMYQRVLVMEAKLEEIGAVADRCAQTLAGEYLILKDDYYAHSARCND